MNKLDKDLIEVYSNPLTFDTPFDDLKPMDKSEFNGVRSVVIRGNNQCMWYNYDTGLPQHFIGVHKDVNDYDVKVKGIENGKINYKILSDSVDESLGILPGVSNACDGHGNNKAAYVQLMDGFSVRGEDAIEMIEILKRAKVKHFDRQLKILKEYKENLK